MWSPQSFKTRREKILMPLIRWFSALFTKVWEKQKQKWRIKNGTLKQCSFDTWIIHTVHFNKTAMRILSWARMRLIHNIYRHKVQVFTFSLQVHVLSIVSIVKIQWLAFARFTITNKKKTNNQKRDRDRERRLNTNQNKRTHSKI